jgi:hypothetical protein
VTRSRLQDVNWIEQIATKRAHIGANQTIAVSSRGFSEPAKRAAAAHGIELRLISEVSGDDLLRIASGLEVRSESVSVEIGALQVTFDGAFAPPPTALADELAKWSASNLDARIFLDEEGREVSLGDLLIRASFADAQRVGTRPDPFPLPPNVDPVNRGLLQQFPDLKPDGIWLQKTVSVRFHDASHISLRTDQGVLRLKEVNLGVRAKRERALVAPRRGILYDSPGGRIAEYTEHVIEKPDGTALQILSRRAPSSDAKS